MLTAHDIWAQGRHKALFGRISFTVERGEVILIQAYSQIERTSLSLALTGRLNLSGGTLSWDHKNPVSMRRLRSISDVIDSPEVTAPEVHMRVHDYVSEMLSYSLPFFGRPRASRWLEQNDLGELDKLWTEQLTGEQNIRLMSALAAHTRSDLLVFDTPSRHLNHTRMWLPHLQELAENEDNPRAVIAVVPHISESWEGKTAVVGDAHEDLDETPQDAHEPIRLPGAHTTVDASLNDFFEAAPPAAHGEPDEPAENTAANDDEPSDHAAAEPDEFPEAPVLEPERASEGITAAKPMRIPLKQRVSAYPQIPILQAKTNTPTGPGQEPGSQTATGTSAASANAPGTANTEKSSRHHSAQKEQLS